MAQTQTPKINVNDVRWNDQETNLFFEQTHDQKPAALQSLAENDTLLRGQSSTANSSTTSQFSNWQNLIVDSGVFSRLIRCTLLHVPKSKLVRREHSSMEPHYLARTHVGKKKNTSVLCFNFNQFCKKYTKEIGNYEENEWMKWWAEGNLLLIQSSHQNELAKVDFGKNSCGRATAMSWRLCARCC